MIHTRELHGYPFRPGSPRRIRLPRPSRRVTPSETRRRERIVRHREFESGRGLADANCVRETVGLGLGLASRRIAHRVLVPGLKGGPAPLMTGYGAVLAGSHCDPV